MEKIYTLKDNDELTLTGKQLREWKEKIEQELKEKISKDVKEWDVEVCCHGIRQRDLVKYLTGEIIH